ncbi:TetR/AcrR family transcriptional regulator [Tsukamurella soli]
MRARLLDATVECLVEYGYAGTTTPRIAARAGVTRGAQGHHFGSKTDLVVAAVTHLAERRAETALRQLAELTTPEEPIDAALDAVWALHQGPLYVATVELWTAARTDPTLAAALDRVEPLVNEVVLTWTATLFPDPARGKDVRDLVYTAMDALRGILLTGLISPDPDRARRRWERARAHLRASSGLTAG